MTITISLQIVLFEYSGIFVASFPLQYKPKKRFTICKQSSQQTPFPSTPEISKNVDKGKKIEKLDVGSDLNGQQKLAVCQKHANEVVATFYPTEFNPAWFAKNPHFQTITGALFRDRPNFTYLLQDTSSLINQDEVNESGAGLAWYDKRERIETPDDDFFHVDYKYVNSTSESKGTVFIQHGLESNSESKLVIDMARSFLEKGFDVAAVNLRHCSGEINKQYGGYHLGFTDDMKFLLRKHKIENDSLEVSKPFFLSGFSLGSNVMVKMMGELGTSAQTEYNIYGAAVANVPFDLVKSAHILKESFINREIYTKSFLKNMKGKSRRKYEKKYIQSLETSNPLPFDYEAMMSATTINEVEDAYICPIYGYSNYLDYYEKNSCGSFVHNIAVPTYAINAKDDVFFHPKMSVPNLDPSPLRVHYTNYGGHCGFMFHEVHDIDTDLPRTSWMPNELSRFIDHVHKNL